MTGLAAGGREQLAALAVLGTERIDTLPELPLPAEVLERCGGLPAPERVLALAGALAQQAAGGALPAKLDGEAIAPCDDAGDRPAGAGAGAVIARIMSSEPRLIGECLSLLSARGWTAPHAVLCDLLARGRSSKQDRRVIVAVLGARGRWLASLNPQWSWAAEWRERSGDLASTPADPPKNAVGAWETGSTAQRVSLLRRIRRSSAPGEAAGLIESTWEQDSPEDREQFIACLEVGLSMADEPLLERALDGKRGERDRAAGLLSALPESGLNARMTGRALSMVTITKKRSKLIIDADPPEALDKAMRRDGIDGRAVGKLGKKASLLSKVVGATPADVWLRDGHEPAALLEAALKSDWSEAIALGWAEALGREPGSRFARGLVRAIGAFNIETLERLSLLEPLARAGACGGAEAIKGLLKQVKDPGHVLLAVEELHAPWPDEVSRLVSDRVIDGLTRAPEGELSFRDSPARVLAETAALRMHPDLLKRYRTRLEGLSGRPKLEAGTSACLVLAELRQRMIEEMSRE